MQLVQQQAQIIKSLKAARKAVLVVHVQPDADALGSMGAMAGLLRRWNIPYSLYCKDVPAHARHLGFLVDLQTVAADLNDALRGADTVVVMDCSDTRIAGLGEDIAGLMEKYVVLNIDHHASNTLFGHHRLVVPTAASTTEILHELLLCAHVQPSPEMATALLAGIIFDTYNFTNPNTSSTTLAVAGQLVAAGAHISMVSDALLKNKSLATMQCWGTILTRLQRNKDYNVAMTVITDQDMDGSVPLIEISEGAANFLNNLHGMAAVIMLQQRDDGTIKGSMRTSSDTVDLATLARLLGGGGHRKAAGFRIRGQLTQLPNGSWQIT